MSNLEKNELIKGAEVLKNDVFRAVTEKLTGNIKFQPVEMQNICFVNHDGIDKIYAFYNPSDKRLHGGVRVVVDTRFGNQEATVVSSVKIQKKYVKSLMAVIGNDKPLKNIVGIVEQKIQIQDVVTKIEDINKDKRYVIAD